MGYASTAARLITSEGFAIRTSTLQMRKPPPQMDVAILPRVRQYRVIDRNRGHVVQMVTSSESESESEIFRKLGVGIEHGMKDLIRDRMEAQ